MQKKAARQGRLSRSREIGKNGHAVFRAFGEHGVVLIAQHAVSLVPVIERDAARVKIVQVKMREFPISNR